MALIPIPISPAAVKGLTTRVYLVSRVKAIESRKTTLVSTVTKALTVLAAAIRAICLLSTVQTIVHNRISNSRIYHLTTTSWKWLTSKSTLMTSMLFSARTRKCPRVDTRILRLFSASTPTTKCSTISLLARSTLRTRSWRRIRRRSAKRSLSRMTPNTSGPRVLCFSSTQQGQRQTFLWRMLLTSPSFHRKTQ